MGIIRKGERQREPGDAGNWREACWSDVLEELKGCVLGHTWKARLQIRAGTVRLCVTKGGRVCAHRCREGAIFFG